MAKTSEQVVVSAPPISVREAEAAVTAAREAVDRLRAVATGEIGTWTRRREQRTVVNRQGRTETVEVEEPVFQTTPVGPVERIRARRGLADAEDRLLLAEAALAEARLAAAAAARSARAEAIERGLAEVRRELPALIREVRAVQLRMQTFAAKLEGLDAPLGERRFQEAAWTPLLAGGSFDCWLEFVRASGFLPGAGD